MQMFREELAGRKHNALVPWAQPPPLHPFLHRACKRKSTEKSRHRESHSVERQGPQARLTTTVQEGKGFFTTTVRSCH